MAREADFKDEQMIVLQLDGPHELKAMAMIPDQPRALAVLFPGDRGMMALSGTSGLITMNQLGLFDFLLRARKQFFQHDVALIAVDAVDGKPMSPDDRERSIPAVVALLDHVRQQAKLPASLPVWSIGNREGSISAVALALDQPKRLSGLVLVSPVTRPTADFGDWAARRAEGIAGMDVVKFDQPVLVLANQDDRCAHSPPADADRLAAAFAGSPRHEARVMSGDNPNGDACGRVSPHNFFALVEPTAAAIIAFMQR